MSTQRNSSPLPPPPPRSSRRSSSPDSICMICLGNVVNSSVTNTCMHEFCFPCLREWSKIKAECPLCKKRFSKIYHTMNSRDEYEEYVVERVESPPIPTNARVPLITRQRVYNENLWALPFRRQMGLILRESNPRFYRSSPGQVYRLIPWLLREFSILLGSTNAATLAIIVEVLESIQSYSIRSDQFATLMTQYLGNNAEHFVHEFYRFAASPFSMQTYDILVDYTSNVENVSNSDSDEIAQDQNSSTLNVLRSNDSFLSSTSADLSPDPRHSLPWTLATDSSSLSTLSREDEVASSSVSTVPSSSSSTDVIVIPSSPSNYSSASPSPVYSSGSDPRRPAPTVITIDDSSQEETEVDVKTESSLVDNITSDPVAGPSGTSRNLLCDYYDDVRSLSDSFSNSSSGEEWVPSQLKKKRKIKPKKKRLPPKKRSKRSSSSDDSDSR